MQAARFASVAKGDATRISPIVSNLLVNANKFTDRGGCVSIELLQEDTRSAKTSVRDTGTRAVACAGPPVARILIVEDHLSAARSLKALLEDSGHVVAGLSGGCCRVRCQRNDKYSCRMLHAVLSDGYSPIGSEFASIDDLSCPQTAHASFPASLRGPSRRASLMHPGRPSR